MSDENLPIIPADKLKKWEKYKAPDNIQDHLGFDIPEFESPEFSKLDRAKQLGEGFAGGVGRTVDIYKKYVESPINHFVGDAVQGAGLLADDLGFNNAGSNLKSVGSQLQSSAQDNWNNQERYEEAFKKPFETKGSDETKEILQSVGKGINEGVEWAGMTAATGGINNVVNVVKMTPKGLAPLKAPWLNKINDFLQFGSQSLGKTATTFGAGRGIEKMVEKPDDSEAMKFTKGLASFVLGGVTVDKLEKPFVNSIKSTSNSIMSAAEFIANPTNAKFNQLKAKIPSLKDVTNSVSEAATMPRDVAYNYIIARNQRAKLDNGAIQSFDALGIPKSALTIYTQSYTRPNAVANYLPSAVYNEYMENVRAEYIKALTVEFEKSFGKIPEIVSEDTLPRTVAERITKGFFKKPDLDQIADDSVSSLKYNINSEFPIQSNDKITGFSIPTIQDNNLKNSLIESKSKIEHIVSEYENVKNYKYSLRDNAISETDTINPSLILKTAEQLRREFDIAGSQGTSIGTVHNVSKDVEKQFRFFNQLKENIFLQEESGLSTVGPDYVFKLKETINQHVNSGFISGNQKKVLTQLTKACDETIKLGVEDGTIKNPDLYKYALDADDFYKNQYINLVKLDIVKAVQNKQTPEWLFRQLDNPERIAQLNNIFNSSFSLKEKNNSILLFNNLKRLKVQNIFAKEFGYSSEKTNTISYENIYKYFTNEDKMLLLKALLPEKSFEHLKDRSLEIAKSLEYFSKISQNPLLKDGNNAVEMILEKINSRKGIDELTSYIRKELQGEKYGEELVKSLRKLAGYEYLLKDVFNENKKLKGPNLYDAMSDKLRNDDLLIGIFGSKTEYNKFKKDLLIVAEKMHEAYIKDNLTGSYLSVQQLGGPMENILHRVKNETLYAVGGYQLKGIGGAIGALLGKNWIARSFANAATDEKMVQKLIKAANKEDNGLSFTKLMIQSANDIVKRTTESQYPKVYSTEKFDEFNKKRIRENDGKWYNEKASREATLQFE